MKDVLTTSKQKELFLLFLLYLQNCNDTGTTEEQTMERIRRKRRNLTRKADIILISVLGGSIGIMTLWAIVQEVAMKLR